MKLPQDPRKLFIYFIHEREKIRVAKEMGLTAPWTENEILAKYRFCNVNREHDRVTEWIEDNIREVYAEDESLWFALIIARLINQPNTLARIYDKRGAHWNKARFIGATDPSLWDKPIFNAAYIVSTNGRQMQKNEYLANCVLDPLWEARESRPLKGRSSCSTCKAWADWLLKFQGMGDFMANQIVTDYKYTVICGMASDRGSFVMAGPGTRRGLNRYFSKDLYHSTTREKGAEQLITIRDTIKKDCSIAINNHFFDLNNLSNCFCEFDKYMRALTGEGRPKQQYKEHA